MLRWAWAVGLLVCCWLGMEATHEFGHCVGAWATGARVEKVVLAPWTISRTDVANNGQPLAVVWAGPIVGSLLPLLMWGAFSRCRRPINTTFRFFAGFCLIANGLYIGVGSFEGIGDCGDLLRYGSPIWLLWLFGSIVVPIGFALWTESGIRFQRVETRDEWGFALMPRRVLAREVALVWVVALVMIVVGSFFR